MATMSLESLSEFVRAVVPIGQVSRRGLWVHRAVLAEWTALNWLDWIDGPGLNADQAARKKELGRPLIRCAQDLLRHFADGPCRRGRPRWTNPNYSPPTPFGQYHVAFTCGMVLDAINLPTPFRTGVAFGRNPKEPYRDANPHGWTTEAGAQWDRGYILGLKWEEVCAWARNGL